MIQDVCNIEMCELLETEPKMQCKVCLSYWDIGIVHCTCGHFLQKKPKVNRKFVKYTMDLLSVQSMSSRSESFMAMKKFVDNGDALADEDHTNHLTEQDYF